MNRQFLLFLGGIIGLAVLDKFLNNYVTVGSTTTNVETFVEKQEDIKKEEKKDDDIKDYEIYKKILRLYSLIFSRQPNEKELYETKKRFDSGDLTEEKLELELKGSNEFLKLHPNPGLAKYAVRDFGTPTSILTKDEETKMFDTYKKVFKENPKKERLNFLQQKFRDLGANTQKFIKFLTTTIDYKIKVAQNQLDPIEVSREIINESRPLDSAENSSDDFNKMFEEKGDKGDLFVSGNNSSGMSGLGTYLDDAKKLTVGSILPDFHFQEGTTSNRESFEFSKQQIHQEEVG